jgi:secreted PhoX family phosphatase
MTETAREGHEGLSRRRLLGRGAAVGAGITLTGTLASIFGSDTSVADTPARVGRAKTPPGYGPLVSDPAGRLALPEGFSYTLIAKSGETVLETGEPTPDRPDGTASFEGRQNASILVTNHEISSPGGNPVPHHDGMVYDAGAFGGTTTLEVDRHGNRVREFVSLAGTHNNCSGGKTPWGTWLSCEETEAVPTAQNGLTQRHGYVFEVDPYDNSRNLDPRPIKALGRYAHEAVVVDPARFQLYLTEDAGSPNGLVYRYTPPESALPLRRGSLAVLGPTDGRLEAMRAFDYGRFVADLSVAQVGTTYDVEWADVPERDASAVSTRKQFNLPGGSGAPGGDATRSRKLEGAWWGHDGFYFVSSFARNSDGSAAQHDGQVWFLDPDEDTITLALAFAYTPGDQDDDPDGPDNITVSPFGGVILAEDGEGRQHLVGADDRGKAFFFARNDLPGSEEFTGPNFSADRRFLFANVQVPGHVFAITGPWRKAQGRNGDDGRSARG